MWRDFRVGVEGLLHIDSRLLRATTTPPDKSQSTPNGGPA